MWGPLDSVKLLPKNSKNFTHIFIFIILMGRTSHRRCSMLFFKRFTSLIKKKKNYFLATWKTVLDKDLNSEVGKRFVTCKVLIKENFK